MSQPNTLRPLMQHYEVEIAYTLKKRFLATDINDAERTAKLIVSTQANARINSIIPVSQLEKPVVTVENRP